MPLIQKTVYIREEDIDKWIKVPNKAEFLHNALNPEMELDGGMIGLTPQHITKYGGVSDTATGQVIPLDTYTGVRCSHGNNPATCEHLEFVDDHWTCE